MATILGGRFVGLTPRQAAEFSFLLAIPTILAASAYDFIRNFESLQASSNLIEYFAVGLIAAFVTALLVIRAFLKFLE